MISTPLKQGFLTSSTPVQSLSDSGYFGSNNKSSLTKTAHKLSPIKEYFKKKSSDFSQLLGSECSDISIKEDSPSTSNLKEFQFHFDELVKEIDFNNLSFNLSHSLVKNSDHTQNIDQNSFPSFLIHDLEEKILYNQRTVCLQPDKGVNLNLNSVNSQKSEEHSYSDKDSSNYNHFNVSQNYDISLRKIKYIKLDILKELEKINCISTLKHILTFLSAADLTKVCCVSKKWKEILISDVKANSKRKKFLKEKRDHKENEQHLTTILKINHKGEARRPVSLYKNVLSDINNIQIPPRESLARCSNRKFDSFVEEGKKLKDGVLRKCPKCEYAAKSQNNNKYTCSNCYYAFCGNCLNPLTVRNHSCSRQTVSIIIGSKKSKKNLKRL